MDFQEMVETVGPVVEPVPVVHPEIPETVSLGRAVLAGVVEQGQTGAVVAVVAVAVPVSSLSHGDFVGTW
jgi:hypothetical protein